MTSNSANTQIDAIVLVQAPSADALELANAFSQIEGVLEAFAVWGETDVILRIRARDARKLKELIVNEIQKLQDIKNTYTYIQISDGHFRSRRMTMSNKDTKRETNKNHTKKERIEN